MKKFFSKEIITGLITIVSLFILYFGLNYLKGINMFKPTNHYYLLMPNVSELQTSSPIYVDGFKVGVVNRIDFEYENLASPIVVLISLDEKMKVQTGSYFELKSGLTSGAYLNLIPNKYVGSYYQPGDTIEGISSIAIMEQVSNMIPYIETMLPRLDSILIGIQTLVNHPILLQSLNNIDATTANLQKSSKQLANLFSKDIPVIVGDLKEMASNFTDVSANMKKIDIESTLLKVEQTIENINKLSIQLNNKDNSMGLLLNDRSVYDNLETTIKNAADLLKDMKEHPKRYVHFSVF